VPKPDNMKRIKGIGPKIEELLQQNGIITFAQLAQIEVSQLQALLDEAGWNNIADPTTWPEQARQLAQ
jgi:predicted flap endonuclease-1-like 5' DNA nuclease